MNYLWKLNTASIFAALLALIPLELMLNVYRISRLTGWGLDRTVLVLGVAMGVTVLAGTVLLYWFMRKRMERRKANVWTALTWIPYFVLFAYLFSVSFPITDPGEAPNPGMGFFVIGGLLGYPFYLLILNVIVLLTGEGVQKKEGLPD
ncbi:hypothetical protein QRD89_16035 [Halobacillus sp. ACCC02827]|uniref:hypothetical protein n=1 Tax=Halobacillus sp. ACCC02827 TaxID=3052090 RepID=UPI0025711BA7|nr:hypothetical protein [Halobacillus sp. ACCC02827]WJE15212.1 hypothetical protein QRD89_16035 [Halobacillus sp. ACCC02827]